MSRTADLSKPLSPIFRIIYCGHCKETYQMRGDLEVVDGGVLRTFHCPSCTRFVKSDFITNPSTKVVDTREHYRPYYWDKEFWKFNKKLLGLE